MILNFSRMIGVSLALLLANAATAQEESDNRVSANTDWSVFVESDPNECWAVSAPKETLNTRDGNSVDVRRGDIRLLSIRKRINRQRASGRHHVPDVHPR